MATDTVTTTQAPWGPMQPYLTTGFQRAEDLYKTGGPTLYPYNMVTQFGDKTKNALTASL